MEYHDKKTLEDMINFYGVEVILKQIVTECTKKDAKSPERDPRIWQKVQQQISKKENTL